ncbi:hypothetical protein ACFYZH_32035 [Streptomyces abikoensis]|uniref:hypothetical protein n=1 Tax=Streptomyces abikoensis TaxID=97398 RepID=UPI0036C77196
MFAFFQEHVLGEWLAGLLVAGTLVSLREAWHRIRARRDRRLGGQPPAPDPAPQEDADPS